MSLPINPPGGGSGPPDAPGKPGAPSAPAAADGPSRSERFGEALEASSELQQGAPAEALGRVAEDLRTGRIDATQAVEQLVQRALESPQARALAPVARGELEEHLRRTLADDPALAALVRDLERGR